MYIKDQGPYPNQYKDAKPQSGTSSILQNPKSGLYGHGCSLHLQNQDREPKFGSYVYQRPVTISKSRTRCQTPVRNLQHPPKPQMRTLRTWMFFAPSKSRYRAKIWIKGISKTSDHIQIKIKMPNPSQEPPASSKAPNEDLKDMDVLCTFKMKIESQILTMGISKTSDHVQIKIKMPNSSQEPQTSSKAPNEDFEDMDVLCTLKIKRERAKIQIMGKSKTSDHIQIKIKMPNPNQEPPASSQAQNDDLQDMDVLCTFKIKIESRNSDPGLIKNQ